MWENDDLSLFVDNLCSCLYAYELRPLLYMVKLVLKLDFFDCGRDRWGESLILGCTSTKVSDD